ncbi:MAG: putative DNA binding domain-containing protein [Actinomyces sp.]|nr:putative DNA binding domain-containing protein [Actinomyces sp.]
MGLDIVARVARLRSLGSDEGTTEIKSAVGKLPKRVWEAVSAFANSSGGVVLLGLDEESGFALAPGFDPQPILDALSDGLNATPGHGTKVTPVPPTEVEQLEFEGGVVVALTVRPLVAIPAPCFVTDQGLENGAYRRWDDQDIHLSTYAIYLLRHRHEQLGTDREAVAAATVQDLDPHLLDRMIARLRKQGSRVLTGTTDTLSQLRRLNVVDQAGRPTLAGLLSVGTYPQQFFPQLFIDVAVHPGTAKGAQPGSTRFLDRKVCEGPIPVAVDQAVRAVARNLRTARVVEGSRGTDVLEIPEEVLREAIVNAATHRDYSSHVLGQQVAVDVYPDRVEIISPGGFWGSVSRENIGEGVSCSRNDCLAKLLTQVPLPDSDAMVCENLGSGVPLMIGAMRSRGLPIPAFDSSADKVKVVLHRFGLLTPETREWLHSLGGATRITPRQEIALVLTRTQGNVTPHDLREQAAVDSDDARNDLERLVDLGLLTETGIETYELPRELDAAVLTPVQRDVLTAVDAGTARNIQELARRTHRSANALRPVLRDLVARGLVIATAPPTSRNRAYLRAVDESAHPDSPQLPL